MKKKQGFGTFDLLIVLLLSGMALYYFMIVPYQNIQTLNEMRSSPPPVTAEDKRLVDEFKAKPVLEIVPSGKYFAEIEINGKNYSITYYFGDDKTVTKEMTILDNYRLSGSAKYHFDGSVLIFTEVFGDRLLFPEIGEAVSMPNENMIVLHGATHTILLKSSVMIEQEKLDADEAVTERREMLDSKSIFDLSPDGVIEKVTSRSSFLLIIFLLLVPTLLMVFYRFYQDLMRGY